MRMSTEGGGGEGLRTPVLRMRPTPLSEACNSGRHWACYDCFRQGPDGYLCECKCHYALGGPAMEVQRYLEGFGDEAHYYLTTRIRPELLRRKAAWILTAVRDWDLLGDPYWDGRVDAALVALGLDPKQP